MIDHRLGSKPEDWAAARLLALHYTVAVEGPAEGPMPRRQDGSAFTAVPSWLDARLRLPFDRTRRNRNWRRALARSEAAWEAAGLRFELRPAAEFGEAEVIDSLYFGPLVREFYSRGISPYGAHNLEAFCRLLAGGAWVGLVRCGQGIVGGAVLQPAAPARATRHLLCGTAIADGSAVSGMVFALSPAYRGCRRALWRRLADGLAAHKVTALSLGRETPWLDARYVPVVIEKLRWADEVTVGQGETGLWLAAHPARAAEQRMVLFERAGDGVRLRGFGDEASAAAAALAGALSEATPSAEPARANRLRASATEPSHV
ncbi:MAG: hypothetical protein WD341_00980 [Tistlia sp.]|uniref:hypothetical protein n=1 Tax=Tistlia sp. TaxID=3057121 RepID=UPI0034A3D629